MKFGTPRDNALVITFDDAKTQLSEIRKALRKGGIKPVGKPVYLEQQSAPGDANRTPPGPGQTSRSETGS